MKLFYYKVRLIFQSIFTDSNNKLLAISFYLNIKINKDIFHRLKFYFSISLRLESTAGRVILLHIVNPNLILGIVYGAPSLSGKTPESRAMSNP